MHVTVSDIEWIEAADSYCCLHVVTKTFMYRETVKHIADTLDPAKFVRSHGSTIVIVGRVREIYREGPSEGSVILYNGQQVKISRTGWQSLLTTSYFRKPSESNR